MYFQWIPSNHRVAHKILFVVSVAAGIVFLGNELQKFHIGKIVVCNVTCDATDVRRQKILLKENFKMLAQDANRAVHRSIEIDVQIADEKVSHVVNLYSRLVTVKGWIARCFSLKCGDWC